MTLAEALAYFRYRASKSRTELCVAKWDDVLVILEAAEKYAGLLK